MLPTRPLALWLLLLAIGCQDHPPTAVVSAMAADATTLARVTHFRLSALRGDASKYDRVFPRDAFLHPGSLTFQDASDGDDRTMLRVRFEGYDQDPTTPGAAPIISNSARLPFVKEKTKLLRLGLSRECLDRTCASVDLTCRHGECVPDQIDDPDTELPDAPSGDGDTLDPGQFDDLPRAGAAGAAGGGGTAGSSGTSGHGGVAGQSGSAGLGGVGGESGAGGEGGSAGTGGVEAAGGAAGVAGAAGAAGQSGSAGDGGAGGMTGTLGPATRLSLGRSHTCALVGTAITCWGRNDRGQLGLDSKAADIRAPGQAFAKTGDQALDVAAGDEHTCARLVGGTLKCWGSGHFGGLGLGDTSDRGDEPGEMGELPSVPVGSPTWTGLYTGDSQTCVLREEPQRAPVCWGVNNGGQLGVGNKNARGLAPGQMDDLPTIDLGSQAGPVSVMGIGAGFLCALLAQPSQVKCWGLNQRGQLGLGDTNNRGDEPGEMGDSLAYVDVSSASPPFPVTGLAVGGSHACALIGDGYVRCWGDNTYGQLGIGTTQSHGSEPAQMGPNLPVVQLGGPLVKAVVAGDRHTCALLTTGEVKCWGGNERGQLGLGDTASRGDEPDEMGDQLPLVSLGSGVKVKELYGGRNHTCARLSDDRIKCWGYNAQGQLGLGDTQNRGDGPGQMGDDLPALPFAATSIPGEATNPF